MPYGFKSRSPDQIMPYKNIEQQREYQRNWIADRRKEFFKDKKCVYCTKTKNLELSHKDKTTKISHKIWYGLKKKEN